MKIVASWPDYGRSQIVAVDEDGQVYALPLLSDPSVRVNWKGWDRLLPTKKNPVQRFEDGLDRFRTRSNKEPKILLLSMQDHAKMETIMRDGLRFVDIQKDPNWVMRFNGTELGSWNGVENGTVVVCDENLKVVGSFTWDSE